MSDVIARYSPKILKQMPRRGWTTSLVEETIRDPERTGKTRDQRVVGGESRNDPATAYFRDDDSYVVRNDRTKDIVQLSDRNDPRWIPDARIDINGPDQDHGNSDNDR
jgi:hypothetical protein